MGNIFSSTFVKKSVPKGLNDNSSSSSSSTSRRKRSLSRSISSNNSFEKKVLSNSKKELSKMMENKKRGKYYYIPDNFKSLDQVLLCSSSLLSFLLYMCTTVIESNSKVVFM